MAVALLVAKLVGQTAAPNFDRMARDLEDAIRSEDLVKAADLAAKLDDETQREFRTSLNRDATQRVDEVLGWLPGDTEALMVLQEPTIINASRSQEAFFGKPAQSYALDRLMALNDGQFIRQLQGGTVRLTVAGMRNIRSRGGGVPALMPDADVVYFFFFSEPIDAQALGTPDESGDIHLLWRGTARIDAGEWKPGVRERAQRDDENWLALARPDMLIVSSRRETIIDLLGRISRRDQSPAARALPNTLPEWAEVDRRAKFWGLRHYSEPGPRRDGSNPKSGSPEEGKSDAVAIGVTVQFDTEQGNLEIHYLSGANKPPRLISGMTVDHEFQTVATRVGVWRLKSSTRDRGDFPFHFAAYMLGFGGYR